MNKDSKEFEDEIRNIYSTIDRIASSGMEFRRSLERCVFNRLFRLFKAKGKEINGETKLSELFNKTLLKDEWKELNQINFRIPELKRSKLFDYLSIGYLILAFPGSLIFALKNLELVFVIWGLPVLAIIWQYCSFLFYSSCSLFQKKHLPAESINQLVDQIVSENWTNLIEDDKAMFHKIMREEMERDGRTSAQHKL